VLVKRIKQIAWFFFFVGSVTMCFGDLVIELRRNGITATEQQIRWAIRTGKVDRPAYDASLRFKFSKKNVSEIADYFKAKTSARV